MQRVIKIDVRLRDPARQQHPRARPVEVADELDRAARGGPASIRPRPVPLMTRHNDSVHPALTRPGLLLRVVPRDPDTTLTREAAIALRDRIYRALHQGTEYQYAERPGAGAAP